jgi:SAM-dependent methyltransferase
MCGRVNHQSAFDDYPWTKEWTKNFSEHVSKSHYSLCRKLALAAQFTGKPIKTMLDVGCGNGAYLSAARKMGLRAEGTDIDQKHVEFAVRQGLRAFYGDVGDFWEGVTYDFVHVKECLHLVEHPRSFITNVTRFMHDDSVLYIDSTHGDGLASRIRKVFARGERHGQLYPPLHNRTYNRKSLSRLLYVAGLQPVRFSSFSKGDATSCPSPNFHVRQITANPLLDLFWLGGFIGVYAVKIRG